MLDLPPMVTADAEKAQTLLIQILDLARSGLAEARRSVEALHRHTFREQ